MTVCHAPKSLLELRDALGLLTPKSRIVSGGTDLAIHLSSGKIKPDALLYPGGVPELHLIGQADNAVIIGAAAMMSDIAAADLPAGLRAVADAAAGLGSAQIRNSATIGGNIANASPAGDLLPALFLLNAEVELTSPRGSFRRPIANVVVGPSRTTIAHDECITAVILPLPPGGFRSRFWKLGYRRAVSVSRIGLAVGLVFDKDGTVAGAEIVAGAVSAVPIRVPEAEKALVGSRLDGRAKSLAAEALAELILAVTPEEFDRDYKIGAARGAMEDVLGLFG